MNSRGGALLFGLLLAATFTSTIIAWRFGWYGKPWLWGWYYWPLDGWRWWFAWGHKELLANGIKAREHFQQAGALAALVAIIPAAILMKKQQYGKLRTGKDTGKRGLGTVNALLKTKHVVRLGDGVVIGCDPGRWRWRQRTLRDNSDSHILIEGPSRSGKGVGHIVPTGLSHEGSMLIFDPKRELADTTARWRRTLGPVYILDPTSADSARFNPLLQLRPTHLIDDCQTMALLMTTEERGHGGGDSFWKESARDLLSVLLFIAATSDEPTLEHVWRMSLQVAGGRFPATTDWWARTKLTNHQALPEKTRGGVDQQLATYLKWLASPLVRHMTSGSDFRASDLTAGDEPVTVYLSIPIRDGQRLRPLTSMILEALISEQTADLAYTADGREKEHKLLAMLDEFPQLGRLDVIERQMKLMAGYGVRLCLVCQDETQIADIYGNNESITSNCGTRCFIAGMSPKSLSNMSKLGGDIAIAQGSKQLPFGMKGSASESQSEARVQRLEHGAMLRRSRKEVVILTTGCAPTYLKKLNFWQEWCEFRGRFDKPTATRSTATLPPEPNAVEPELSDEERVLVDGFDAFRAAMTPAAQAAIRQKLGA